MISYEEDQAELQRKLHSMFADKRVQYARDDLREASQAPSVRPQTGVDVAVMRALLPELRERREHGKKVDLLPEARPLFLLDARPVEGLLAGEDYRFDYYRGGDMTEPLKDEDRVDAITDAGEYRLVISGLSDKLHGSKVVPFEVEKGKKGILPWLLLLLGLLAAVALAAALYFSGQTPWYDPNAGEGLAGLSDENIQALLNAKVEEGMMNVTIISPIDFPDGTLQPGKAGFNNLAQNHFDQKMVLTLADSGEVLYESGAIAPGQNIEYIILNRSLDAGWYDANATVTGYDRETHEKKGSVVAKVQLIVS